MSGGLYLKPNGKPKKKKIILIVLGCILGLIAAVVLGGYLYLQYMLRQVTVVPDVSTLAPVQTSGTADGDDPAPTETTNPEDTWPEIISDQNVTNIMLVGQNYRYGEENKLSDTMILCSINRETKTLYMTSFLRDLYVTIPAYAGHGQGRNRINVCYNLGWKWTGENSKGGMEMLALAVEQNFGIPVHHTIEINFDVFSQIVDLIGGVEVEVSEAEAKYMNTEVGYLYLYDDIVPGLQRLNGDQALAYARIRAIDNDFNRSNRQRTLITSMLNELRGQGLMDLHKLAMEILPMIITDMTVDQMNNYIWEFIPLLKDLNIVSQTCPVSNETLQNSYWYTEVEGIGYVIECNPWLNKKYLQEQLGFSDAT